MRGRQMSEAYLTGAVLAAVGGYLDAYTYLCRGHVLANAQTGNIVLLGVKAAAGEWGAALYYAVPILAFIAGIFVAELVKRQFKQHPMLHWRQIVVLLEAAVLAGVAFIPVGDLDMLANVLISFVCSLQVESFRTVSGIPYATTMCTGNLRSATEHLYRFIQMKERYFLKTSLKYYGIILFFILGACAGALLTSLWSYKAVAEAAAALLAVFLLMFIKDNSGSAV